MESSQSIKNDVAIKQGYFTSDRFIAGFVATVALVICFAMNIGITCSNDAAHYYLSRAMIVDGTVATDKYRIWMHADAAQKDGHFYSDRAPGLAFTAIPFHVVAMVLPVFPEPINTSRRFGDPNDPSIMAFALIMNLAAAGVAFVGYKLLRRAGVGQAPAMVAALAAVLATPMLKYGATAFSHGLSAFFYLLVIYLLVRALEPANDERQSPAVLAGLAGLATGYAVGVEYTNLVLVPLVAVLLASHAAATRRPLRMKAYAFCLLGMAVGVMPTLVYHQIAFGSIFSTGYKYKVGYTDLVADPSRTFSNPLLSGIVANWYDYTNLRSLNQRNVGLLPRFPVLAAALMGLILGLRGSSRWTAIAVALGAALCTLVIAKYVYFSGNTFDSRFMTPAAVLTALGLGFILDKLSNTPRYPWNQLLQAVILCLLGISIVNSLRAVVSSHGYSSTTMPPEYVRTFAMVGSAREWRNIFRGAFPNVYNLHYILIPLAVIWAAELLRTYLKVRKAATKAGV